ncbi:MAG: nitrilase-related carbon-nitrogen hydrolase [Bacteroidales bacterium]
MKRTRLYRSLIIILINACLASSLFAAKIAIVQYEIQDLNEVGVDAGRLENFIREAAAQGADLVVTPETSFYRYEPWEQDGVTMLDLAKHYDELKSKFSSLAEELNISLVIGLREPSGHEVKPVFNTALFIGPGGKILGKQHKVFPSNAEMKWTRAGITHSVFETAFGRVGMMICKTAKTNWWNSFKKEDDLDLFILIAGDKDASSFDRFSSICVKSNCYGLIANQICGPDTDEKARKGNSSWGYPDGRVDRLGGGENIFYLDLPLPVENSFGPQYGQIMVDPDNPSWLVYNRDENRDGRPDPYFMCGPGDPEGFLYRGIRNLNGTRCGDQMNLIEKVRVNGGNCIYLMAVRTHGGDAWKDMERDPENFPDKKHNPWVGLNPAYGLNPDILDQWELWFTEMDRNGITIYLFIYDDAIRVGEQIGWHLDEAGNLHPGEKQFLQDIVNKFEHHKNLVWCIMEEGQEIGKDWQLHISKIAEAIREADDHNHVIANHQLGGNVFYHADDPNIDQFAIQGNWETGSSPDSIHTWLVKAWDLAKGRYNLNMAEYKTHDNLSQAGDREGIRKNSWAIAMAGSYIMVLGMEIINTPPEHLQDCRHLQHFFESTNFNYMAPHDELKHSGTEYVLASPGYSYIAYSSENSGELGLQNIDAGTYDMRWYDCVTGQSLQQNNTKIPSGRQSWKKPPELGDEVALYITRSDGKVKPEPTHTQEQDPGRVEKKAITTPVTPNIIPIAPDQRITTKKDTPVYIQLTYNDADGGPGPYTTSIIIQPSYGKLTGVGNDQTYTPVPGYTGIDTITWKVNDGADDSEISTIHITIEK